MDDKKKVDIERFENRPVFCRNQDFFYFIFYVKTVVYLLFIEQRVSLNEFISDVGQKCLKKMTFCVCERKRTRNKNLVLHCTSRKAMTNGESC